MEEGDDSEKGLSKQTKSLIFRFPGNGSWTRVLACTGCILQPLEPLGVVSYIEPTMSAWPELYLSRYLSRT